MVQEPERWRGEYERDGYLVVKDVLDEGMLGRLRAGIEKITGDPEGVREGLKRYLDFERSFIERRPGMNELGAAEVGNAIRNIMELPLFDRMFAELICYPPVLDVLEALFGTPEFVFHNYKCIVKAAKVSSKFVWHRDLPYLPHTSPNLLTAMLCLDAMTEENGATVVMPGTHRVRHEDVKASDVDIAEGDLPADAKRVTVCCPAGSLVVFHVNIIHGGGANRSASPRRNVIGIWEGPDAHPVTAARYAYMGLMPRSRDEGRRRQVRMTFPGLGRGAA